MALTGRKRSRTRMVLSNMNVASPEVDDLSRNDPTREGLRSNSGDRHVKNRRRRSLHR